MKLDINKFDFLLPSECFFTPICEGCEGWTSVTSKYQIIFLMKPYLNKSHFFEKGEQNFTKICEGCEGSRTLFPTFCVESKNKNTLPWKSWGYEGSTLRTLRKFSKSNFSLKSCNFTLRTLRKNQFTHQPQTEAMA